MPKKDTAKAKALQIVRFALEKKAINPLILDLRKLSNFCDYFVIVSGDSAVQTRAIYKNILDGSAKNRLGVSHKEDDPESRWLLIDYSDVLVHVFLSKERSYFDLEYLWKKAKKVPIPKNRTNSERIQA